MPYYNTILKFVSLLLLVTVSYFANSQNITRAPYSSFGIGDIESMALASSTSLGGIKYAIADPYQINISNPATYSTLTTPNFNVGLTVNSIQIKDATASQKSSVGYLKNMLLAFQINKKLGMSFGLTPYSKMGYQFTASKNVENLGVVQYLYNGKGGINRLYFGLGYSIIDDSLNVLSIGANATYLFGSFSKEKRVIPDPASRAYNARYIEKTTLNDFRFDYGLYYKRKITKNFSAALGASYTMGDSIKSTYSKLVYSYQGGIGTESLKDTIYSSLDSGNIYLPQSIGVGITFQLNKNKNKFHQSFLLGIEYSATNWSKMKGIGNNSGLANQSQIGVGFQYIPDSKAYKNIQKMIQYRVGFRYQNTRLMINNNNLKEYGMSFGVGIPIISAGTGTMFNLGMEIGQRGNIANTLVQEQFTNFNIGFSLTPARFDRWFLKSKIN